MASFSSEVLGNLHEKLIITVSKDEYKPLVESGLKRIAKSAAIKGFRQGMVPVGVVKKMYGNQVLADELSQYTSKKLDDYLYENNIHFLGHPLGQAIPGQLIDIENEQDYKFAFELGIQPKFELPKLTGNDAVAHYTIKLDDSLLEKEIEYELTRNGKSNEVTDVILIDDVISIDIKENVAENPFTKTINLLIKNVKDKNSQQQLMDMKPGQTITFDFKKAYADDMEMLIHRILGVDHHQFDHMNVTNMSVTLNKIFRLEKATIDETLFEKVFPGRNIKTEAEFKEAMKQDLAVAYARETERKANHDLKYSVIEHTPMEFPAEFLRKWIKAVNKDPLNDEQVNEGFASFLEDLKWTLIRNKIVSENQLQIKEEDLQARVMDYLNQTYKGMDEATLKSLCARVLENEKEKEYMVSQMVEERVINYLRTQNTFVEKEISFDEFENMIQHHNHGHGHSHHH